MPALAAVPSQPAPPWRSGIVAESPAMRALLDQIERVAPSTVPVLLTGETGVGKDVLARALHEASGRPGPFVPVNCAALPAALAESELFGHVRGAFTGAERSRDGLIGQAHGGTLLLDEVGELDLTVQAKLLRVLEDGAVRRVGSTAVATVDLRLVCATNRDLLRLIEKGRFREDLYHRIAGVTLHVPPLRDRPEDISVLVARFLRETRNGSAPRVSDTALTHLRRRRWPGNVRELRNAVRAAALFGREVLRPEDFVVPPGPVHAAESLDAYGDAIPLDGRRWCDIERTALAWALRRYGNIRAAACALNLPRSTFADRLRRHGIRRTPGNVQFVP